MLIDITECNYHLHSYYYHGGGRGVVLYIV